MMLEEANARLKTTEINEEQLWAINSIYILLDLDKDVFCKVVDTVGIETLIKKQPHYDRLMKAEEELSAKERYIHAKSRLKELEDEKANLEQVVSGYKQV